MIAEYFGLRREPFERDISLDDLVLFHSHHELTAGLMYAAQHRQMALVTGDTGTGKTTAVRAVMKRMDESVYRFLYIASAGLTSKTLYRVILEKLQIQPKFRLVDNQLLTHRVLEEMYHKGQQAVIVVDEAHELDPATLADIRYLTNYQADSFSPISLWLVGQTELRERMKLRMLAALSQRVQIRFHMAGMTEAEVPEYITRQLTAAGAARSVFSGDAMKWVAKMTQGNPRLVNTVCKSAMLDAALRGDEVVDMSHVERAWMEVSGA
ncbi:MAG: Flp pilus assembly complex ATPase component TadA [Alicyclobacillus sp.]|nr:Flp pilus assembly complex ATPase component TadA [Alicyclobacillus sp.]